MKLITEHAGDILTVIVGIALLIGIIWLLKTPINNFFTAMVTSLQNLGNNVISKVSPTAPVAASTMLAMFR